MNIQKDMLYRDKNQSFSNRWYNYVNRIIPRVKMNRKYRERIKFFNIINFFLKKLKFQSLSNIYAFSIV